LTVQIPKLQAHQNKMNHFNQKNFSFLQGAGGPKKPDPPPPPTLKPPVMGDLQAISSYEYVENVDLISDGSIDSLVNQRGEYVNDAGIFEGIYLEDVPIRQSFSVSGDNILQSFDLSFIATGFSGVVSGFSGHYYDSQNNFLDKSLSSTVSSLTGYLSGVGYSVLNSKKDIANSVYASIQEVNSVLNSASYAPESSYYKQLRSISAKFNYKSSKEVQSYLLPNFPQEFDEDYPFFCLKLSVTGTDFSGYNLNMFTYLDSDLLNQTYLPLESTELQNRRFVSPPPKIDLTYCGSYSYTSGSSPDIIAGDRLCGSMYVFAYKESDKPLKNSIDAIINNIKSIKLVNPSAKYNFGNASMEIRNGDELQKPLSLFNKTYLDKSYGTTLRGPFAKGRSIPTLYTNSADLNSRFDENSQQAKTGVDASILSDTISYDQYSNALSDSTNKQLNVASVIKSANSILSTAYNTVRIINCLNSTTNVNEVVFSISWYMRFVKEKKGGTNKTGFFYRNARITFNKVTGKFSSTMTVLNDADNATPKPIIKTTAPGNGYVQSSSDAIECTFLYRKDSETYSSVISKEIIAGLLKACLDFSIRAQGSDDTRLLTAETSYSNWNKDYIKNSSEPAIPIVHIVNNPNVDRVYISISVRVLRDIAHKTTYLYKSNNERSAVDPGTSLPSVINFRIEIGYQDKNGIETIIENGVKDFQIKGTADSPATIDIGREENNTSAIIPQYSRFIMGSQQSFSAPLILPPAQADRTRFVRIYRTTYESYSSLVKREISLDKVSEIINLPFSYPYSTICGLKLDARTLPQIPSRSYDARFKKVFIPSNYFPLKANGKDKRYITSSELAAFNTLPSTSDDKIIYRGNWDGTFKFAWTDNPAWIIFDLLINRRYGLGNFISPTQVNYWELYKIAQFCDAVDKNGLFVGVPAADGGLEPRYGFNGVIADKTNVFDMIKSIVASFRGNMFYTNSEINFTNDRLKPIISSFNNSNVKDGSFSYTNSRKDLQYNVIEVSYLDRDDLFKEKIEYVEDPDDIKTRGILRTSAQTFGVTSRAHAKRIGQHTIYSTINEDQNVQFVGGLETLLCRPGDLIAINDELRTLKKHVGRVLDVDLANSMIHTNIDLTAEAFNSTGLFPQLSVLIPTGKNQFDDFYNLAKSPSKLNISELYQTDIPQNIVFNASGTGFDTFGAKFYLDLGIGKNSGMPLLENIKIGVPCSVTLANTSQEIYKIQSIKELNLNEYEVIASKFDTGKFAEIEAGESLNDFFSSFPDERKTQVNEGSGYSVNNQVKYDLTGVPLITSFTTGNFDAQNDVIDINGAWQSVNNANSYNVELITPKYRSIKKQTSLNSVVFEDQSEVGVFTLKVSAVQTGVYPVLISATHTATLKVLSYTAPVRSNGILTNMGFGPATITD
jgi:hypothetical protein